MLRFVFTFFLVDEVKFESSVAVTFAENIYRPFRFVMPLFVSMSALGGLNGQMFSIVRMFSVAGRDGLLPRISSFVHYERLTPVVPILVETILSIFFVLVGDADRLLGYLSFSVWLVCLCAAGSVLIFRRTMPNVSRPVHAGKFAPILFIVSMSILTLINMIYNPRDILVGILILLSGLPVYWIFVLHRPSSIEQLSRSIVVYLQKFLLVIPSPILPSISNDEKETN